jgi:DNA repair protein RecN (Recombination protein N)
MLSELHIKNISIIEDIQVKFHDGFQALSGETGAGKSFLVQAVQFVLGARADTEVLRKGSTEAAVTAVFSSCPGTLLQELNEETGLSVEDLGEALVLRRLLSDQGRSRAFLNDHPVTMKTLQKIGGRLIRHVGQFAAQELFSETFLIDALDQFGGHEKIRTEYGDALADYRARTQQLRELQERIQTSREREDFLRFQLQELVDAKLKEGEEEELESQKQRLKHRVALAGQSFEISQCLQEGEDSLAERLGKICQMARKAASLDASLAPVATSMEEALERLQSAAAVVRDYASDLQEPAESFDQIETRLEKIHQLKRKYRLEVGEMIARVEQVKKDLGELEDSEVHLEECGKNLAEAEKKLIRVAKTLRQKREGAAAGLSERLKKNLKDLSLSDVRFNWEFRPCETVEEYKSFGAEILELWVSFNPGEEPRPFQEVISGGELSRLFLALYEILTPVEGSLTFILDEVDAGVSGAVAEQIGKKLARFGKAAQVLCITHLPQIASRAEWQFVVEKSVRKGRTYSEVRCLNDEERVQEIARMLAGVKVTEQALRHARELLSQNAA